jgi:multisubunit Na+/H+ antiporter MnhE subunit
MLGGERNHLLGADQPIGRGGDRVGKGPRVLFPAVAYHVDHWQGGAIVALYALATCGSLLASSHRPVRWFGAINLIAVCLLAWLYTSAFISLWCLWAAVTSVAIDVHLRRSRQSTPGVTSAAR